MSKKTTLYTLIVFMQVICLSQTAYAWTPSLWGIGGGSNKYVWDCPAMSGKVELNPLDASVDVRGLCNFEVPSIQGIGCHVYMKYTPEPAYAPTLQQDTNQTYYTQDWYLTCGMPLQITGSISCDDNNGTTFSDPIGFAFKKGTSCSDIYPDGDDHVMFSASTTYDQDDLSSKIVDFSPNGMVAEAFHADGGKYPYGKVGQDTQLVHGTGNGPTIAYTTYTDPITDACGNNGTVKSRLDADVPAGATDQDYHSINLDVVDLQSFKINGISPEGGCVRKSVSNEDVIECTSYLCDESGTFKFPGGVADLKAHRLGTNSTIESHNLLQVIHDSTASP
jgi:hypothetical protein